MLRMLVGVVRSGVFVVMVMGRTMTNDKGREGGGGGDLSGLWACAEESALETDWWEGSIAALRRPLLILKEMGYHWKLWKRRPTDRM